MRAFLATSCETSCFWALHVLTLKDTLSCSCCMQSVNPCLHQVLRARGAFGRHACCWGAVCVTHPRILPNNCLQRDVDLSCS